MRHVVSSVPCISQTRAAVPTTTKCSGLVRMWLLQNQCPPLEPDTCACQPIQIELPVKEDYLCNQHWLLLCRHADGSALLLADNYADHAADGHSWGWSGHSGMEAGLEREGIRL